MTFTAFQGPSPLTLDFGSILAFANCSSFRCGLRAVSSYPKSELSGDGVSLIGRLCFEALLNLWIKPIAIPFHRRSGVIERS